MQKSRKRKIGAAVDETERPSKQARTETSKDVSTQRVTRSLAKSENLELSQGLTSARKQSNNNNLLIARTKPDIDGRKTSVVNAERIASTLVTSKDNKAYKKDTTRFHWKGFRDLSTDKTTGLTPFITERDDKRWTKEHEAVRQELRSTLTKRDGFTPHNKVRAENSHLVAGSMWGPNDFLSAPPASVHQNTEWLAIETGLKKLAKRDDLGGELQFKGTGYVYNSGEHKGTLKAARFKIYIGKNKVFDHLTDGHRGNIDEEEARGLMDAVASLRSTTQVGSIKHSKGNNPKGVDGKAPTLDQVTAKQSTRLSSTSSPMFTDVQTEGSSNTKVRSTGDDALKQVAELLKRK